MLMNKTTRPWLPPVIVTAISLILRIIVIDVYYKGETKGMFDYHIDPTTEGAEERYLKYFERLYIPMYVRASGYALGMLVGYYHFTQVYLP